MTTRLVVCFDGTWNRPDPNVDPAARIETNVCRFYEAIRNGNLEGGDIQKKWYDTGVGTNWYDRVVGGAFGIGIDQKIRDGYQWLVENYPDPDPSDIEVFVLGFSRGAYTARSLVGMIRNCGLLLPENAHRVTDAYALYRQRDEGPDTNQVQAFRDRYSREIKIKFLGVWDTVGALGIPLQALQWLNATEYAFHDTELTGIVENAAHALAIDEFRVDYQATLWAPFIKPGQNVEQRWFVGAHADVGGGYRAGCFPTSRWHGCSGRPRRPGSRSAAQKFRRSPKKIGCTCRPTLTANFSMALMPRPIRLTIAVCSSATA
jgi:uncharacterized protein (DUF2235 family)